MNPLGIIHCWLVRFFGGKHKMRRLRKAELTARGNYLGGTHADMVTVSSAPVGQSRICDRCHATKTVRQRKAKA